MCMFYSHHKINVVNPFKSTLVFSVIIAIAVLCFGFSQNAYAIEDSDDTKVYESLVRDLAKVDESIIRDLVNDLAKLHETLEGIIVDDKPVQKTSDMGVEDEPEEYKVAISLIGVGEINREIGTYDLDFWYSIAPTSRNFSVDNPPPEVDFINGKTPNISPPITGPNISEKRVQGIFVGPMDFRDFPFEKIHLIIELEPVNPHTTKKVILSVDPGSGIVPTAHVIGWEITNSSFNVVNSTYDEGISNYTRYIADYTVERNPLGSFLKLIFPILVVTGVGFVAYVFPKNFDLQAALALLPLGAIVFLQVNTLEQIPPLGFLTLYDKMMVIVYALIANNVIAIGRQVNVEEQENERNSYPISKFHIKISPIIAIVLGIILFVVMPMI